MACFFCRACFSLDRSTVSFASCQHGVEVNTYRIPPSTGTTGYEEAAAQGVVAGINAGLAAVRRPPLILDRSDGFVGVMIDDLITKGAEEPCERSEFMLNYDLINADRPNVYKQV